MNDCALISRRRWLCAAAALSATSLGGCGNRSSTSSDRVLRVFNWSDYIHEDVIPEFEQRRQCSVVYDNYSSDAELETRLATGGGGYDVVFPSDRAMAALLAKDLLSPIDMARLANFRHLDAKFLSPPFDRGNHYSVPYFWGTVAVGLRTDKVTDTVHSFEPLFDPRYRGRITMLDDLENAVAAVLLHLGLPLNSVEPGDLAQAQRLLLAQKALLQAYTSDAYKERLYAGDAWVSLGWSGDLLQAARLEPRVPLRVVVPKTGTMIWLDSMAIPRRAPNVELAHAFIDYLLEPPVALRNATAVQYATPNVAAQSLLPAAQREDESVYPPAATLDRCAWLENRGTDIEKIEAIWRQVRA
ncbi:MAG TPA: spermidine/putrescine ABC transporter substrate-binding protein [Pirellulales bacterium]